METKSMIVSVKPWASHSKLSLLFFYTISSIIFILCTFFFLSCVSANVHHKKINYLHIFFLFKDGNLQKIKRKKVKNV